MKFLLTFFLIVTITWLYAEGKSDRNEAQVYTATQSYDILLGESKIGNFTIERLEEQGVITYNAKSNVSVRIIKEFSFVYTLNCVYKADELVHSKFVFYKNGEVDDSTIIDWHGNDYLIIKNQEEFRFKEPVFHSAVQLYFERPFDTGLVFSEKEGEFMDLQHVQPNQYDLIAKDKGRTINYIYEADLLKEVIVDLTITEFRMVRQQVEFTYP